MTRRITADLSRRGFVAGNRRLGRGAWPSPIGAGPKRVKFDAADRLHEFSPVRRQVERLAWGARSHRRGRADQGGCDREPDWSGRARTIDCGGRVVMPGLIDAHWHSIFAALPIPTLLSAEVGYIFLAASAEAERTLMRGFTTVRDLGGPVVCAQTGDRRRTCAGTAHLSMRRHDHDDRRPRGHASPIRSAAEPRRPGELDGADGRRQYRRQRRRSAPAGARAAPAGRVADQARGRRRGVVAAHHPGHADVQRARASRARGSSRRSEHLRHRARVPTPSDPAGDRRRRSVHRARASDGRSNRKNDGGQGRLAEHSTLRRGRRHRSSQRSEPGQPARRSLPARTRPTRWRKPTNSRRLSARICCFLLKRRRARGSC